MLGFSRIGFVGWLLFISLEDIFITINIANNIKPKYIITIGAYKTTDVDFTKYNIKFDNYFDYSGIGQKSPGVHIKNVSHLNMQKHVNKIF